MRLETRRESSATEENLEKAVKEVDGHHLRRAPARLPLASSLVRCLLLLPAIKFFWSTSAGEKEVEIGKGLKTEGLVKGWGHPRFLFMGLAKKSWPEIMVHIPRNFGGGETSLTESSSV
jgi:hypothetical protein